MRILTFWLDTLHVVIFFPSTSGSCWEEESFKLNSKVLQDSAWFTETISLSAQTEYIHSLSLISAIKNELQGAGGGGWKGKGGGGVEDTQL